MLETTRRNGVFGGGDAGRGKPGLSWCSQTHRTGRVGLGGRFPGNWGDVPAAGVGTEQKFRAENRANL
jgi:hypothetical protein